MCIPGTQCFSNTDFPGSFGYRNQHNIHNSNSTNQKGNSSNSTKHHTHGFSNRAHCIKNLILPDNQKLFLIAYTADSSSLSSCCSWINGNHIGTQIGNTRSDLLG